MAWNNLLSGLFGAIIGGVLTIAGGAWIGRRDFARQARFDAYRTAGEIAIRIRTRASLTNSKGEVHSAAPASPTDDELFGTLMALELSGSHNIRKFFDYMLVMQVRFHSAALPDLDDPGHHQTWRTYQNELREACINVVRECGSEFGIEDAGVLLGG